MEDRPRADVSPFDDLVEREFAQVVALALAILRDGDDAVDVAQETMMRAFERWPDVSRLDRPGAWCRRVALNLVTDRLRSRTRARRLVDRLRTHRRDSLAGVDDDVWDDAFWAEVARLPPRQRSVIVLHYVNDLAVAEVAGVLEVPEGTVKSDLSRARSRLASRLGGVT